MTTTTAAAAAFSFRAFQSAWLDDDILTTINHQTASVQCPCPICQKHDQHIQSSQI